MIESVISDVGLGLAEFFLTDELDPVAIWIQCKSNILHSPVGQFLLEFNSLTLKPKTSILQGTHRNTNLDRISFQVALQR